jgi:hypothetical protein
LARRAGHRTFVGALMCNLFDHHEPSRNHPAVKERTTSFDQYIESRKIEMSYDPDEDVTLNGAKMSLRSAVAKVMALSPDDRMGAVIFRNGEPPILDRAEIEDIADLPGFQDHP